jgi:hypothetical protein
MAQMTLKQAKSLVHKFVLVKWLDHSSFDSESPFSVWTPVQRNSVGMIHEIGEYRGHAFIVIAQDKIGTDIEGDKLSGLIILIDNIYYHRVLETKRKEPEKEKR